MRQWQGYVKNATATATGGYSHFLGMFFGQHLLSVRSFSIEHVGLALDFD